MRVPTRVTNAARATGELLLRRPWLATLGLCVVVLALPAGGPDYAAQLFRTGLFRAHGSLLWDNSWYSGHLLAGYSLLFPPLAGIVGPRLLGAASAVAATTLAGILLGGAWTGRRRQVGMLWFAVVVVGELLIGRLPFLLGVALGLAALVATARNRPWAAGMAAALCSLTSPLAGAFVVLVAASWAAEIGPRRAGPLGAAVLGIGVSAALGDGGTFPFPASTLVCVMGFALLALVTVPPQARSVRRGLALYAAASLVLFVVPNPVGGGNMARLGALAAGPVAAFALGRPSLTPQRLRLPLAAAGALAALAWQLTPVAQAVAWSANDPASEPSYYVGLTAFLHTQDATRGRLEIPPLRQHWEAAFVAPVFPLARGWERQTDTEVNPVLYQQGLDADALHRWLLASGVRLVALPDAALDRFAEPEAQILAPGQPWLRQVWSDPHWTVWQVVGAPGLIDGRGRVTELGVDSFTVVTTSAAPVVVRLHWNRYWRVLQGGACLAPTLDGWTQVTPDGQGPVTVAARWSVHGLTEQGPWCQPRTAGRSGRPKPSRR